jgi:acetate kinase
MKVLVINGGSSTFKCWFHELSDGHLPSEAPKPCWEAHVEWKGGDGRADARIRAADGRTAEFTQPAGSLVDPLPRAVESLWSGSAAVIRAPQEIEAIGHRIVHGGVAHRESTRLTPEVRAAIARQAEFAPSHNRFELEAVQAIDRVLGPHVPQVAVFDTAFHATLEPAAYVYPGPYEWLERGVRRFGFHGISFQYATQRAAHILGRPPAELRLLLCHLGNGGSLAAVRAGQSVDTTMGFTPLEGLMMGTRSGSVDPGILVYLLRHQGYSPDQLDRVLNRESGLLGISGRSGDLREVQAAADDGDARAQLAFVVYMHRLVREAGAMLAVLGGLDALVFTGGIGENSPQVREGLCRQLAFAGLCLDEARNRQNPRDHDVASDDSPARILVIHAEEEWEIARECHRLLGPNR